MSRTSCAGKKRSSFWSSFLSRPGATSRRAIGTNNASITYAFDLSIDPDELRSLSDADLADRLERRPRPLRKIKRNAAPCMCPLAEAPPEMLGGVEPAEFVRRARLLRSDRALVERLVRCR